MSNSTNSLQSFNAQAQTEQTVQPVKKLGQGTPVTPSAPLPGVSSAPISIPQDTVTVSEAARQAQSNKVTQPPSGDAANSDVNR